MLDPQAKSISLTDIGIEDATIFYQLTSDELHQITLEKVKEGNPLLERLP